MINRAPWQGALFQSPFWQRADAGTLAKLTSLLSATKIALPETG